MLILAVGVHARHGGFFLLGLLVLVVLGLLAFRLSTRGKARSRSGGTGSSWGYPPAPVAPPVPRAGEPTPEAGPAEVPRSPAAIRSDDPGVTEPAVAAGEAAFGADADRVAATARPGAWRAVPDDGWAVETHGLTKRFGSNVAVDDVELFVPRGCAFGYLGPNGAGKTTLIRTLLGLTKADGGTMSLLGIPVPRERSRALARVGAIVDEPRFHDHLTGRENLALLAAARGAGAGARIDSGFERVGLTERADDKVASYSMGMRQRLGVAACLLGDPELLILDEPMNGLDPAGMQGMRTMVKNLVGEGRTVVLSSHLLDEVERTCDAVAIVDRGRVIRQGPIDELLHGTANRVVQMDCGDAGSAVRLLTAAGLAAGTSVDGRMLTVTLQSGANRETVAEVNRRLVEGGIAVYRLQEVRTSLEDWFLAVTSRFGERP
ncbi:MAG: ABC transporter ATP-binding protein [Acidimicrobiales bacterium]|jgi:ABC-2 type transport system ATP-binding protein